MGSDNGKGIAVCSGICILITIYWLYTSVPGLSPVIPGFLYWSFIIAVIAVIVYLLYNVGKVSSKASLLSLLFAGILVVIIISSASAVYQSVGSVQPGQATTKTTDLGYSIEPPLSPVQGDVPKQYLAMKTGAVSKSFPYVLRGEPGTVNLTMYQGVSSVIAKEDPYSYVGEKDRYQKFIDLPVQDTFLIPLVDAIREKSRNPDDQVRIAVSLVQQIPFDQESFTRGSLEIKYPYQTLLDDKGLPGCEKSVLLAYILHKLGYGVVIFDFDNEKHTTVGIRVSPEYAYKNTGYAFIETSPIIITDGGGDYYKFGRISSLPEVLPVGDGKSFDSVSEEWNDAREFERLNSLGHVLSKLDYSKWQALCQKYGIVPGKT